MIEQLKKRIVVFSLVLVMATLPFLAGCSTGGSAGESGSTGIEGEEPNLVTADIEDQEVPLANQPAVNKFLIPTAPGITLYKGGNVQLDASNTKEGYLMVQYSGTNPKIKVQITKAKGITYTYDLNARKAYEVFPLSEGDGAYTIKVFENISGTKYSQAFSKTVEVKLTNAFLPFLYPNQYVNFGTGSTTVAKGLEVTKGTEAQLKKVEKIYNYVVGNLTYDKEKAATVKSGYLPEVDRILAMKKGICFDYAAVMATMLRSQNIPAKLVVGYAGEAYHAWINVYTKETGWVDAMIYFDGDKWHLMDPTFASSAKKSKEIMKYIGDGKNYTSKYTY
jgi:hypothetical protein